MFQYLHVLKVIAYKNIINLHVYILTVEFNWLFGFLFNGSFEWCICLFTDPLKFTSLSVGDTYVSMNLVNIGLDNGLSPV